MKKITLLINSLRGGGAEKVCVTIANGLARQGWSVNLLVLNLEEAVYDSEVDNRVCLVDLKTTRTRNSVLKIAGYLREQRSTKLLIFNPPLAMMVKVLIWGRVAPNAFLISRSIDFDNQILNRNLSKTTEAAYRFFLRFVYSRLDFYIAQSQYMKTMLIDGYKLSQSKVAVINNPVSSFIEASAVNSENMTVPLSSKKLVLCVGRLHKEKGFDDAIRVFLFAYGENADLRLTIIGAGDQKVALVNLVEQLGLQHVVRFTGFCSDLSEHYSQASVLLLTSHYEAFPNVAVEALTFGVPVVAFNCPGGISELVEHSKNGYLVPNRDQKLMSKYLLEAASGALSKGDVLSSSRKYSSTGVISKYCRILESFD